MPSLINATTTNGLVTSADNSGSLQLQTNNGTTAVTIDTSQNVGIGTSSPNQAMTIQRGVGADAAITFRANNNTSSGEAYIGQGNDSSVYIYNRSSNNMVFGTNNAERMRIDSSGNLLVGSTARVNGGWVGGYIQSVGYAARSGTSGSFSGNAFNINWTGNANLWIDSTNIGQFSFVSDYRIKRNIQTQTQPALERVMQLRPVTYQMADYGNLFKASDEIKEGFIAHEVQEVIPSGVDGEKDAENQIQSLRVDAILAVAVKAIQEQQAQIEELKAKVSALEGAK